LSRISISIFDPSIIETSWMNPNVEVLDTIYERIADFVLQLYQFDFSGIGAISKDP
jgi:hypothetical protein